MEKQYILVFVLLVLILTQAGLHDLMIKNIFLFRDYHFYLNLHNLNYLQSLMVVSFHLD